IIPRLAIPASLKHRSVIRLKPSPAFAVPTPMAKHACLAATFVGFSTLRLDGFAANHHFKTASEAVPKETAAMPRYFFNTRIGDDTIPDVEGEELRDADHAWEVA